ncbi:hypothetical protein PG997_002465 [Apiospora hydei]|uniref:Catalase n=1 Tax=Apiospora hydei TaxID=1337664 RepID=A0ABR1X9L1_9PEZI
MAGRAFTTAALMAGGLAGFSSAAGCPYAAALGGRADDAGRDDPLAPFTMDDSSGYMTDDLGGQITDQDSLKVGPKGPTLLEDFIFRQKITHFDHERVPERAVHARGAGAHGTFTSYGDWSNITAASFLSAEGKKTPMYVRFSTVAGSRGSADTARDVHGFATRFYTDEGNFDIVGNNIPVFFIQDAIRFPDLIHSVKPSPDKEIPQAATAHDSAWDFFSSQPSALHTLFWAMAGFGIPRSFRHMDGFGIHAFRLVTDEGKSTLIKWHWKSKQGKASLVWEEAQIVSGKNADMHRQDLWDAIESGNGPEWELAIQVIDEEQARGFDFDYLDATKIIPEEYAPLQKLGVMKLDRNPTNYFAETEQIMFQPGHIVRGVDFTDDPLLQGRIFSYLDTQINRHGGPNFEQLPINRGRAPVHNNNRDGAGQMFIHKNTAAYSPNTLNKGYPQQATQKQGRGFFTAPDREVSGKLVRALSSTFDDHWTQPRLFYNSLTPVEQQFLVNAMRFEASQLKSEQVKKNVLTQLNRVSHDVASRVASALGMEAPAADPTYYHDNTTMGISITNGTLPTVATLKVGILTTAKSMKSATALKERLAKDGLVPAIVAEYLAEGVDKTYSAADATDFDSVVRHQEGLDPLPRRPALQIANMAYLFGKPVGYFGGNGTVSSAALSDAGFKKDEPGMYMGASDMEKFVEDVKKGLATFKFTNRFPLDE